MSVRITYDPRKSSDNLRKHGLSLADAQHLEWETLRASSDMRRDYGETRMIGLDEMAGRIYCVIFTDRKDEQRIISLRKANLREIKTYAAEND